MPQRAFVWQRRWTPAVEAAVAGAGQGPGGGPGLDGLDGLVVLAAEIEADGQISATDALNGAHTGALAAAPALSLALRAAALPADPAAEDRLVQLAARTAAAAAAEGLALESLHLDIDVPTARLDEYARLVTRVRAALAPLPVEVLALPTWIGAPGLPALQSAADRLVLQVHGLDPAPSPGGLPVLFDAEAAKAATEALAATGLPFSLALPTHGWTVQRPEGPVRLRAEPAELAPLVAGWTALRPAALEGLCWFRLPVEGDGGAWSAAALARVRAGERPTEGVSLQVIPAANGLSVDILVEATGEDEGLLPAFVVEAPGRALPGDLWLGGRWSAAGPSRLAFTPAPGARVPLGGPRRLGFVALPDGGPATLRRAPEVGIGTAPPETAPLALPEAAPGSGTGAMPDAVPEEGR